MTEATNDTDKAKQVADAGKPTPEAGAAKKDDSSGTPSFWSALASGNLTRNPLGIIGLFIGLIYGCASMLLTIAAGHLDHGERMPLIWFIVGFPVLVLATFYRLVTKYHENLYAPGDFKDDQSFLQALDPHAARQRVEEKLESVQSAEPGPAGGAKLSVLGVNPGHSMDAANRMAPPPDAVDQLVDQLTDTENLAVARLQKDLGQNIRRQVSFGDGRQTAFDGVVVQGTTFTAIEVKLFSRLLAPAALRETIARALLAREKLKQAHRRAGDLRLMFVLVTPRANDQADAMLDAVKKIAGTAPIPVDVKLYRLEDLKEGAGTNPQ